MAAAEGPNEAIDGLVAAYVLQAPATYANSVSTHAADHLRNMGWVGKQIVAKRNTDDPLVIEVMGVHKRMMALWLLPPNKPLQPFWTAEIMTARERLQAWGMTDELALFDANTLALTYGWQVDGRQEEETRFLFSIREDKDLLARYFSGALLRE